MSQSKADYINVIGAGLAGSEAAYQIAKRGIPVKLYEMRGVKATPQHKTTNFAELVCSNSFRGDSLTNAVGLLKEEMRRLDSIIMRNGEAHRVPAGGAMAVDREGYAEAVTAEIENHPLIEVIREEITEIPDDAITVIASGPLTSDALAEKIHELNGGDGFYFYDAAAPIVDKATIDMNKVYLKSRYDKGEAAYLNCPMTKEEFMAFYEALTTAEEAGIKYQYYCAAGGTDAGAAHLQNAGVPSTTIGVCARYIHSHQTLYAMDDFLEAQAFLQAIVKKLDRSTVDLIKNY